MTDRLTLPRPPRRVVLGVLAAAAVLAAGLQVLGTSPAVSQAAGIVAHRVDEGPGLDPHAGVWDRAAGVELALTAQQTSYPFGGGSIPEVEVRALHDDETLYLRMEWADGHRDDAHGVDEFADAVAVELPGTLGASVPALCMGQADGGVNIWRWRAGDLGEAVGEWPASGHPDAYVDLYPSTDDLWFPAREVGNPYANPGLGTVQDLVAEGFGTLAPAAEQTTRGHGEYRDGGRWSVVVARPFASPGDGQPAFSAGATTDIAFAVWDGAAKERGGEKSVSEFAQLEIADRALPASPSARWWIPGILFMAFALVVLWLLVRPSRSTPPTPEGPEEASAA
ncbi:MAG: ethylbenzene dehydrogenase-related protein [Acidimicrobiia bacterium]|nr:ethylbenzene dehydrogenase-related protein [Acidimicrobiia bacterium]